MLFDDLKKYLTVKREDSLSNFISDQSLEAAVAQLQQKLAFILALAILVVPGIANAQQTETAAAKSDVQSHVSKIDGLLKTYHEYGQFNGAVLVAEKGEPILRQGYGNANMEWDIPNSPDTKFRIGSVTKQFTAALILQLVEEGKVKLDEPITTYLTDYRKDTGDEVTVHHLLCHTSGVPSYTTPDFFANHSRDSYDLDEFIKRFASGDLEFKPGTKYVYSNSGYHLLGAIVEKASGKTYAEALQDGILTPIGMSDSGYDVSATVLKNRAQGYSRTPNGYINANYLDMGIPYSAGSMYSTVDDLFKWDRALRTNTVLNAASKKLMFTPNLRNYGYGVDIGKHRLGSADKTTKLIQHGGGINGFNCLLTSVVDQNHCVVVLDNVGMGNHHGKITAAIINILNDLPFEGPRKSLADELQKTATEQGGKAVVARYRKLKTEQPDTFDFGNEEALNGLGYYLVSLDKMEDAIEVLKLNVEIFPESFNPYDSLGEAYLGNDQRDLALLNYKKSVELNPENQGGLLAIKKIEGTAVKVDADKLAEYVGKYELRPGLVITITVKDGALMGQPTGQETAVLESVSDDAFLVPSVKANVKFTRGQDDKVTGMTLKQGGQELEGKRIE